MAEGNPWKSVRQADDRPLLLIRARFDGRGYQIQLTDLSRIWSETLSKREIIERASDSGCSIDPSEDDQYQILLGKLQGAINNDKDTSLNLQTSNNPEGLLLSLSAPLPGSLPTFRWSVRLSKLPDTAVGMGLVTPLILQAFHLQRQVRDLIDGIFSKDRVISKLTERWELNKTDLAIVFPGVSVARTSRKNSRSQREQYAAHVRGLGEFDEGAWRASSAYETIKATGLSPSVLDEVLKDMHVEGSVGGGQDDEWWLKQDGNGRRPPSSLNIGPSRIGSKTGSQIANGLDESKDSDRLSKKESVLEEFQRQGTPLHLKVSLSPSRTEDSQNAAEYNGRTRGAINRTQVEDETTESDDDLDAPPAGALRQMEAQANRHQQDAPTETAAPIPHKPNDAQSQGAVKLISSPQRKTQKKLGGFGGKPKSMSEGPEPAPEPAVPIERTSPPKVRPKLGTFGGKVKQAPQSPEPAHVASAASQATSRLGASGGKAKKSSQALVGASDMESAVLASPKDGRVGDGVTEEGDERTSRAKEKTEPGGEEQERQRSEERADRKRERLKRELEEKSKLPAKKKKRKF